MLQIERIDKIREYVIRNKYANIAELAELFKTSQATIRRCLKELENEKLVQSVHGGAILVDNGNVYENSFQTKCKQNADEKDRIAQTACKYIQSNKSIYLDSSSTVLCMTKYINGPKNVSVSTNDVLIASELTKNPDVNVYVIGGALRKGYYTLTGYMSERDLQGIRVDYAFMGVDAISGDGNFMITNLEEIGIKKIAAKSANHVIVLCDHLKFERTSFLDLWNINDIELIITGKELSDEIFNRYSELGLKILRV